MSAVSRAKRSILAAVVIIVVIVAGLGIYFATQTKPSVSLSSTSTAGLPNTLVVDDNAPPDTLDPGVTLTIAGVEITDNVLLPLNACATTACTSLVPVLATSWTASSDGLTYTYLLRNGVYYNNGDPFNAYVVWWNVYRDMIMNQPIDFLFYSYFNTTGVTAADINSLNNPQNTPEASLLQVMENPHNSVTVLNSSAIQFHLTNRFVAFMVTVATGTPWAFNDPYVVEQHGGVVANQPNSWMATNGTNVGNGPYITQLYVYDEYAKLVANPNYWAQNLTSSETNIFLQPAKIPEVIVNYKTDELTRSLDVESSTAQAVAITFDDIKKVLADCANCYVANLGPTATVEWVAIDSLKPPLDNALLRRAIISAINVTQIQQIAYNGYVVPVVGPEPTTWPYYDRSISAPVYNVTLAKQLLAEAGYPNGAGLRPIDYYYGTSTVQTVAGEIMKADLAEIGITVNLHEINMDTVLSMADTPGQNATAPDMWQMTWSWYSDFSAYEYPVDSAFGSFANMHNATIVNLILESDAEMNPTVRAQEISQITQDVQQSASIIWLGQDIDTFGTGVNVFNKCVAGVYYSADFPTSSIAFNSVYYTCAP